MPSVRSSTRLETDGNTSERQKIVRLHLGIRGAETIVELARQSASQAVSAMRQTPLVSGEVDWAQSQRGQAVVGLPLPRHWRCHSGAFVNACYYLRPCLAVSIAASCFQQQGAALLHTVTLPHAAPDLTLQTAAHLPPPQQAKCRFPASCANDFGIQDQALPLRR